MNSMNNYAVFPYQVIFKRLLAMLTVGIVARTLLRPPGPRSGIGHFEVVKERLNTARVLHNPCDDSLSEVIIIHATLTRINYGIVRHFVPLAWLVVAMILSENLNRL